MIELSIIVPVYNVEKYLEECIDSLLCIEKIKTQIICIDDYSSDNSRNILYDKYGDIDNIEIYVNEKNMGLAVTRNIGLSYVKGKYVMFVDSDDYINSALINDFIYIMNNQELELLYFDVEEFADDGCFNLKLNKRKRRKEYILQSGPLTLSAMVDNQEMFGCVWDGIYKTDFLSINNIKFIGGILHEDIPFTFEVLLKAKRVNVINKVGYYYRQRRNSLLHKPNYLERAKGLIIGYFQNMIIWNSIANNLDSLYVQKNISTYINSVVSMIESNLDKTDIDLCYEDPIIKNFIRNFKFNKKRVYEELLENGLLFNLLQYKSLAIYGAGKYAKELVPLLIERGVNISVILVSKTGKNVTEINGIPVVEYANNMKNKFDAILIAVSNELQLEISDYLKEMGFKGKIIAIDI